MDSLLAQTVDSLGGAGAGWTGAGLFGAVLAWLLFVHLPASRKHEDEMRTAFRGAIDTILTHCQDEMRRVEQRMDEKTAADRDDRHEWLERVNVAWLKAAAIVAAARRNRKPKGPRPPPPGGQP